MLLKRNSIIELLRERRRRAQHLSVVSQQPAGTAGKLKSIGWSKNERMLFNFGFITCLVGSFWLCLRERERGIKTVKLSESTSSGGRARFLPSPAKKKKKARTSGNGEWNWPGICFVLFNYYTAIYVWTVFFFNFRTSGLWIQNEKEKKRMVWFLFDFIFLALCSLLLVFVEFCSYFWSEKNERNKHKKAKQRSTRMNSIG